MITKRKRPITPPRKDSHIRQLEVLDEAVINFNNIKYKFKIISNEGQSKLLNEYHSFGSISLARIKRYDADPNKKGKNKLYLYPDIELTVYYFYLLKKLIPLANIKIDYLGFEQLIMNFVELLRERDLIHYERAIRFMGSYR